MMLKYHSLNGRIYADTTKRIGAGGEGIVYQTNDPSLVAKMFAFSGKGDLKAKLQSVIPKIKFMIANPPVDPCEDINHVSIAWPRDILLDEQGHFCGFVMPSIKGEKFCNATWPKLRKKHFPRFDWESLHTVAANVARIFGAVHDRGYVIGDVKADNLLIDPKGFVTTLDTDSYQVFDKSSGKHYLCRVSTDDYAPPEFRDESCVRDKYQDYHGLGVLIHQLLFSGQHPFQGSWAGQGEPPGIPELMKLGYFPYAPGSPLRPSGVLISLDVLDPRLQSLVRRCFIDGKVQPTSRPSPQEWISALEMTKNDFDICSRGHVYSPSYGRCPWCHRHEILKVEMFSRSAHDRVPQRQIRNRILTALQVGDERKAAQLWGAHSEIRRMQELQSHISRLDHAVKLFSAIDRFCEAYQRNRDNLRELSSLWTPEIAASQVITHERVAERTVQDLGQEVKRRLAALTTLEHAISAAGLPPFSLNCEEAIVAKWNQAAKDLPLTASFMGVSGPRVKDAQVRLASWKKLQSALNKGDEREIVAEWDSNPLLNSFAPAISVKKDVRKSRSIATCLAAFEQMAVNPNVDDDQLLALWKTVPFMDSSVVASLPSSVLGGLTPHQRKAQSEAVVKALDRIIDVIRKNESVGLVLNGESLIAQEWDQNQKLLSGCGAARCVVVRKRSQEARFRLCASAALTNAIHGSDDRAILSSWPMSNVLLQGISLSSKEVERIGEARSRVDAVDRLLAILKTTPHAEEDVIRIWSAQPLLKGSRIVQEERIGEYSVEGRVTLAQQRVRVVQNVKDAIAAQDAHYRVYNIFSSDMESQIRLAFEKGHSCLNGSEYAEARISVRARQACERLEKAAQLLAAFRDDDERGVAAAWGDGALVRELDYVVPYASRADDVAGQVKSLEYIEELFASNPFDDDRLLSAWREARMLRESTLSRKPSQNLVISAPQRRLLSPHEVAERAERRLRIFSVMRNLFSEGVSDDLKIAQIWDEELCGIAPVFRSWLPVIRRSCAKAQPVLDLLDACAKGNDARICELWDEGRMAGMDILRPHISRVRQAIIDYMLPNLTFGEGPWSLLNFKERSVTVKWPWTNREVQLCCVSVKDSAFSDFSTVQDIPNAFSQLVTFDEHRNHGVTLICETDAVEVCVWPVVLFLGERLLSPHGLFKVFRRPIQVTYAVRPCLFCNYELEVLNLSHREVNLPCLKLVSRERRPPTSASDGESVVLELPPTRLESRMTYSFRNPKSARWRRNYFGLFPDHCSPEFVIQHPFVEKPV